MSLLPPKPPAKKLPNPTVGYRPPDDQAAWFKEKVKAGWPQSELLAYVVGAFMHLEKGTADIAKEIEAYARSNGLMTSDDDGEWFAEAMVQLIHAGLAARSAGKT